ncbi:GerMN domain-containing protein [Euzebya sp.]|uniref:GerMN domain-containing protein n=1 Tax=Euzebya sp. TaxID=1971409 RepID=UPI00351932FF
MARRRVAERGRGIRLVAVLVVALAAVACSGDEEPTVTPTTVEPPSTTPAAVESLTASPSPSPAVTSTATATPSATPSDAAPQLSYFLVRDASNRLWVEPIAFDATGAGEAVARAAFTELLAAPDRDGLVNLIPDGTELLDIAVADRVLTVDLSAAMAENPGAGAAGEVAAQQAIAHTGAQFPTVDVVQVLVEGEAVTDLWGHADWSQPLEPDPFAVSPIVVTQAVGEPGQISLTGSANTFEATIEIEVTDQGGGLVAETFTTATCGSGCRGDFTTTITDLAPGTYDVTLRAPDPSGGEAPDPPFAVTVPVTVPS